MLARPGKTVLTDIALIDIFGFMPELELIPKQKREPGEVCCEPVAYPDLEQAQA